MRTWRRTSRHRLRSAATAFGLLASLAMLTIGLPVEEPSAAGEPSAGAEPSAGGEPSAGEEREAGAAAAESSDPAGARRAVEETLRSVLAVLDQQGVRSEERRKQIEEIAYQRFDFATMSKLVVARPWRKFSKEQKRRFVSEFRQHLSRSYGRRIDRYQQTSIEVVSQVMEPRGDVTVKTVVTSGEFKGTEVNYRLRYRNGRWKAIDVVIEGVSLVSNFRSQFKPILSQGSPEDLLQRLAEKNADLAAEDASEAGSR